VRFPIRCGDYLLADRGYSTLRGIRHVAEGGGRITKRMDPLAVPLRSMEDRPFDLLRAVKAVRRAGSVRSWEVRVVGRQDAAVAGRLCALRKTQAAIRIAHKRLRKRASKKGSRLQPQALEFAKYVIVFTTFPIAEFTVAEILEWYRTRWQVELVFKRFKSLAQLGHLPKHDDESAKAWLYGKLLVALLVEKLIAHARALSPWGYRLAETPTTRCGA